MKKTRIFLILTPLIIGILIYLMYRSRNLYYYKIIHSLNISGHVEEARTIAKYYRRIFPTWAIYSLPDGLWLFSTGAAFLINRNGYFLNLIWFTAIYLMTTFMEILQRFFGGHGTKLGTYDRNDMYFFTVAYFSILIISIFIEFKNKNKSAYNIDKYIFISNIKYSIIFLILGILPSML